MSKFQELQDKHIVLLQSYERHKESPDLLKDVKEYTEQVVNDSREIGNSRERNQIRANLRFWGAYIYDHTGTYPNLDLLPSEVSPVAPTSGAGSARWIIPIALIFFAVVFLGMLFPRTLSLSQAQMATSTMIPIDLFVSPLPSVQNPMEIIEGFAKQTAAAQTVIASGGTPISGPQANATATVGAAFTQAAAAIRTSIPTTTALPTGGGEMKILGHASSSTKIQDDISCSSHRIKIKMIHSFASDKFVEPAVITISEEGTFRKIAERQISLTVGDSPGNLSEESNTEINISGAKGSYLIYIEHPKLTFDTIIIQHLPDCHGNLISITYDIPSEDYDELESRPNLGVKFNLITWGPYPSIEPTSVYYGVAKIRVNSVGNPEDHIFWIRSGTSTRFELLQGDEFIASSYDSYYIGITLSGKTVSIPFISVMPYVDYIQKE